MFNVNILLDDKLMLASLDETIRVASYTRSRVEIFKHLEVAVLVE